MGFTTSDSIFNNPVTNKIMLLRLNLERTPWYHFMERIYIKSEIRELEKIAFSMGVEIAINDLVKVGILTTN